MILEGIVTTRNPDRTTNTAPMGPMVPNGNFDVFELRPFQSSRTFENLCRNRQGILHVTDDVQMMAQAAIHCLPQNTLMVKGQQVDVDAIASACRWYEFEVLNIDQVAARSSIQCRCITTKFNREFFGLNRAKYAVLEATILATRIEFLPIEVIVSQLQPLRAIVDKTGGEHEKSAFDMIDQYIHRHAIAAVQSNR